MLWLDEDELFTLTGYRQRAKQRTAECAGQGRTADEAAPAT